ncbi:MAG: thioredoxin family protein [Planctomycetaceae bacterium]
MSLSSTGKSFQFLRVGTSGISRGMALVVLLLSAAVAQAGERWLRNYDEAMAAAERTGRPVLTIFTGSDWCPHCVTLEKKVLDSAQFLAWAENRVVLLMIDLPQQGISTEERQTRSKVCIKYGVRSFPNTVLIAPDGAKITAQSGYHGQTPEAWLAALDKHVPAPALAGDGDDDRILSSLDEAVETARDSRKPMLLLVSRPSDSAAKTRVATLIQDPEFDALTRDNFVVAQVPPQETATATDEGVPADLLGGATLPPEAVEVIVTEDGETAVHVESGAQPATRIVTGLRRFLATRQAARHGEARR